MTQLESTITQKTDDDYSEVELRGMALDNLRFINQLCAIGPLHDFLQDHDIEIHPCPSREDSQYMTYPSSAERLFAGKRKGCRTGLYRFTYTPDCHGRIWNIIEVPMTAAFIRSLPVGLLLKNIALMTQDEIMGKIAGGTKQRELNATKPKAKTQPPTTRSLKPFMSR